MKYSVAIPSKIHNAIVSHLIRADHQEDLCFALWHPSYGKQRTTALIYKVILPELGDRNVHGNVGFMPQYFERVLNEALSEEAGIALMHSHPTSGWQHMSLDDINAEQGNAGAVKSATGLPFVGLTVSTDGAWSARFWIKTASRTYTRSWCQSVRVVGNALDFTFHPDMTNYSVNRPELNRTVSAWGEETQITLANMKVGIIGAGSVGSIVAEALARMGVGNILLLDFDTVEDVNLDRLLFATRRDALLKRAKVKVLADSLHSSATADSFTLSPLEWSLIEEEGYREALDCDILFSCVDRPLPRFILNFIAYAHLIPVVDGGIAVRHNSRIRKLRHADWQAHTVLPTRPCLQCLKQYDPGLVSTDRDGYLDDPVYIDGLPDEHPVKHNENVFAFSLSVASFEVLQFLSLIVAPSGLSNPGAQRYRFVTSTLEKNKIESCASNCDFPKLIALGDHAKITVTSEHTLAKTSRQMREEYHDSWRYRFKKLFSKLQSFVRL